MGWILQQLAAFLKELTMSTSRAIALLAGLACLAVPAQAQQFRLEEVSSIANVAVAQLKPKTIVFADAPSEDIVDAGTGFMRYEDWAKAKPVQRQFLVLYPSYTEPDVDLIINGAKRHYREKLHMYVAEARVALSRPAASLDLARLATLPFVEQIDPAIKHRSIAPAELAALKEPKFVHNQDPQRRWCEAGALCIHSSYKLEGRLPAGIALANKIREAKKISDTLEFDSELVMLSPAEVAAAGLTKLTGIDTPAVGALQQSIFYVNQVMEFGKLMAVFQQHPSDPKQTIGTVHMALAIESNVLGKRKELAQIPILRNLVPAQVLAGKSSFNSGNSLSAGLPVYARNRVKAIATMLDGG
jgi:hypothetical protein